MLLHRERGLGCTLRLSMEIQPLECCFDGCVLRLRLLVASVPGSLAGGRDGTCLMLDLVVRCSSTSGACSSSGVLGPSVGPQFALLSGNWKTSWSSSEFLRFWIRFSSSHCWSLLHWRHLSVVRPASAGDRYLSGLWAGDCGLLLRRRIHARVWLVACLPLLREWRTATSQYP